MPSVPGCIQHYTKLAAAINEAHTCHKSLCACWLDLECVHHNLIQFSLNHYHAPEMMTNMVSDFYSGLTSTVSTRTVSTQSIPLRIGVYQGDPLSVTIFNTVMNTYVDGLKKFEKLGYKFTNSNQILNILQYAENTCLVTDRPSTRRTMLDFTPKWLQWSQQVPGLGNRRFHRESV